MTWNDFYDYISDLKDNDKAWAKIYWTAIPYNEGWRYTTSYLKRVWEETYEI